MAWWNGVRQRSGGSAPPPPPTEELPRPDDWQHMPPLPLTVGSPSAATDADAFVSSLATRQPMAITSMRRHVDSDDAPHGELHVEPQPVARTWSTPPGGDGSGLPDVHVRHVPIALAEHRHATDSTYATHAPIDDQGAPFTFIDAAIDDAGRRGGAASGPDLGGSAHVVGPVVAPDRSGGRQGLAASRRLGLGPAYHGALPDLLRDVDPASLPTEPAPDDLRQTVEQATGVDVGPQVVHRGQAVTDKARDLGATAFMQDDRIYVSDDVGPLDSPTGRSVVAHELTHLAQARRYGPVDESSPEGVAFEAQAQSVEQQVRGDADAADLVVVRETMRELVERGVARPDGDGGISFVMPPSAMTGQSGVQRLAGDTPPAHSPGAAQTQTPGISSVSDLFRAAGSDMLSGAGSMLGLSDDVIEGARHDMNRDIDHGDIERQFRDVTLEHRRTERLDELSRTSTQRVTDLSDDDLDEIRRSIDHEVSTRMDELERASNAALAQLNAEQEHRLRELPDIAYDNAFRRIFDPDSNRVPTADDLAATMHTDAATALHTAAAQHAAAGGTTATHPGGPPTHPGGTPGSGTTGTGTGAGTHGGPGPHPAGGDHAAGGGSDATPAPTGLAGLRAGAAEFLGGGAVELMGSFYGLSEGVQADMRHDMGLSALPTAHDAHAGTHPDAAHPDAAHPDAAHPDAAHPAAHAAAGSTSHRTSATGHDVLDIGHLDLTELAERLYPSIRSKLRNELLIDRERAGRLADFR